MMRASNELIFPILKKAANGAHCKGILVTAFWSVRMLPLSVMGKLGEEVLEEGHRAKSLRFDWFVGRVKSS
jgi:hypothetical protein